MNNKALLVAKREYFENLSTKTFWIGILLFPVLISLSFVIPILLEKEKDARVYQVIDHSNWLFKDVQRMAHSRDVRRLMDENKPPEALTSLFGVSNFKEWDEDQRKEASDQIFDPESTLDPQKRSAFLDWWNALDDKAAQDLNERMSKARFVLLNGSGEVDSLKTLIREKKLFAYFEIPENPLDLESSIAYVSNNLTDESLREWFAYYANHIVQEKRFQANEIDYDLAQSIIRPVQFDERQVTKSGKEEKVKTQDTLRQWVPVGFVYLLWIAVFSIAQMLLTNTVEEKSNRIIEVLLSSVSPLELMTGKVLGIAATGMTIVLSWVITLLAGLNFLPGMLITNLTLNFANIAGDPFFLASFVVYFLLGYLLYAAILVAMGSICNSLKEAQNLMGPVTIMLMIPLLSMVPIGKDPNGTLAKIMSYFPPFTPFVMMNRAAGPPEVWEYVVTTVLLVLSIALAFWLAAKIFRVGVLMTGKPPRLKEIWGWIKTPVGALPQERVED